MIGQAIANQIGPVLLKHKDEIEGAKEKVFKLPAQVFRERMADVLCVIHFDQIWTHKKKGGLYSIRDCKQKDEITGNWIEGFVYTNEKNEHFFRSTNNFYENFTTIFEEYRITGG